MLSLSGLWYDASSPTQTPPSISISPSTLICQLYHAMSKSRYDLPSFPGTVHLPPFLRSSHRIASHHIAKGHSCPTKISYRLLKWYYTSLPPHTPDSTRTILWTLINARAPNRCSASCECSMRHRRGQDNAMVNLGRLILKLLRTEKRGEGNIDSVDNG